MIGIVVMNGIVEHNTWIVDRKGGPRRSSKSLKNGYNTF